MEMPVDREDFDFEVFETDDVTPAKKLQRLCLETLTAARRNGGGTESFLIGL